MILYFSGTGNSKYVAKQLAALLHDELFAMEDNPSLSVANDDKPLGIVFPIYAWGLPRIVEEFLKTQSITNPYVWTVMTCGDDMGYADEVLEKVLKRKVNAAYSLQMPNTYVCLPGFDVDAPEVAAQKMRDTEARLPHIAQCVQQRAECRELYRGRMAWIKTYVLRPLFDKFLVTDRFFKTNNQCIACGLCAKHCPTGDITMAADGPSWLHRNCTGCLRCYHHCPTRAIEWGAFTGGKGQKAHPRG